MYRNRMWGAKGGEVKLVGLAFVCLLLLSLASPLAVAASSHTNAGTSNDNPISPQLSTVKFPALPSCVPNEEFTATSLSENDNSTAVKTSEPNALIILDSSDRASMQSAIDLIENRGGHVTTIYPPCLLIGRLPENMSQDLVGQAGIVHIYCSDGDNPAVQEYGEPFKMTVEEQDNMLNGLQLTNQASWVYVENDNITQTQPSHVQALGRGLVEVEYTPPYSSYYYYQDSVWGGGASYGGYPSSGAFWGLATVFLAGWAEGGAALAQSFTAESTDCARVDVEMEYVFASNSYHAAGAHAGNYKYKIPGQEYGEEMVEFGLDIPWGDLTALITGIPALGTLVDVLDLLHSVHDLEVVTLERTYYVDVTAGETYRLAFGMTAEQAGFGVNLTSGVVGVVKKIKVRVNDTTPPPAPIPFLPFYDARVSTANIDFSWIGFPYISDFSGISQYDLQIDDDPNFSSPTLYHSAQSHVSATLPGQGTYYWRVRAVDGAGNEGSWSNANRFTVDWSSFTVGVSLEGGTVTPGASTITTVTVTPQEGYNKNVTLSTSGAPSETSITFNPTSGTPTFSSAMTISTSSSTPIGDYAITVMGEGEGGKVQTCIYILRVIAEEGDVSEWPMFHRAVTRSGYTSELATRTGELLWESEIGNEYLYSSPAVAYGKVYVGSDDHYVYCLDAFTGNVKWSYPTSDWVCSSPAVVNGTVYVGSLDGYVYALDASTSALRWRTQIGDDVWSPPAVAYGMVYVGGCNDVGDSYIYALNDDNGAIEWNVPSDRVVQAPAAAYGKVYVGGGHTFYALDSYSGGTVWSYPTIGKMWYASPAVVDGYVYISDTEGYVYSLDASTGAEKWKRDIGDAGYSSPAVANGRVYVGSFGYYGSPGYLYALDISAGDIIWSYPTGGSIWSGPAVAGDGAIYFGSDDGIFRALNSDGTLRWSYATGSDVRSSPAIAYGQVYFSSYDGNVYCLYEAPFNFELEKSGDIDVVQDSSASNTITVHLISGISERVDLSGSWVGAVPNGVSTYISFSGGIPTYSGDLTITTSLTASAGSFVYRVTGSGESLTRTIDVMVNISGPTLPSAPQLISPTYGAITDNMPTFRWNPVETVLGVGYTLQYSTDLSFPFWLEDWQYRRRLTLTNTEDEAVQIVPIELDKSLLTGARQDLADVRFVTDDGYLLRYFQETENKFFVRLVEPLSVESDKQIWLYYGNQDATSASDSSVRPQPVNVIIQNVAPSADGYLIYNWTGGAGTVVGGTDHTSYLELGYEVNPTPPPDKWQYDPILKFDMFSFPSDIIIENARLQTYCYQVFDGSCGVGIFDATRDDWTEDDFSGVCPGMWMINRGYQVDSVGWKDWDVTEFVKEQFEGDKVASLIIEGSGYISGTTPRFRLYSREAPVDRPYLEVTWGVMPTLSVALGDEEQQEQACPTVSIASLSDITYSVLENKALTGNIYYWRVRAVDGAGNPSEWSSIWQFALDTVPITVSDFAISSGQLPLVGGRSNINITVSYSLVDPSPITNTKIKNGYDEGASSITHVKIIVSDNEGRVVKRLFYGDENADSAGVEYAHGWDGTYENGETVPPGTYWIWIVVRDVPGNCSFAIDNITINTDTTPPPSPELISPENGMATTDNTPVFEWADVEDPSGVNYTLQYSTDLSFPPDWLDSAWSYRAPITITEQSGSDLTDYQVRVDVTYSSHMQPDFDDLRFTDSDGATPLSYWIENYTVGNATVWVKVPFIPASPSEKTIYMYYGNSTASSASNAVDVFDADVGFDSTTGWTEVDPNSQVTIDTTTDKRIEFTSADGTVNSYIYHQFATGLTTFCYEWAANLSGSSAEANLYVYLGDSVNPYGSQSNMVGVFWNTFPHVDLGTSVNGTYYSARYWGCQPDTTHYFRLTVASSTSVELKAWVNAARSGDPVFTLTLPNVPTVPLTYWYAYSPTPANYGDRLLSGWVDTTVLCKYAFPEPTSSTGSEEVSTDWTKTIDSLTETTYTVPEGEALLGGTYYWRVRAVDGVGNIGDWSEVRQFTVPTIITNVEQLQAMNNDLGGYYVLGNDIDASATHTWNDNGDGGYYGFEPIGSDSEAFTGSFDGQGYKIINLYINRPDNDYVGLFGYVGSGGVVKNVGLESEDVSGYYGIGGLVGWNCNGIVTNCYSTGSVSGDYLFAGGLVGYNTGTVSNCYSTGSVSGDYYVGGLIGANYNGAVSNSYSTGSASGIFSAIGGLAGYNSGTIINCYSTGTVSGEVEIGGLVGYSEGTVTNCYSTGTVNGSRYTIGGLVGYNMGTVTNCYSTGTVSGDYLVGGLIGGNYNGTVSNSYSTGTISGNEYVGGLVGGNAGTVSNSFWDIQTSGQSTSAGGVGKTTVEMKTGSTFTDAGWDFVDIWDIDPAVNDGYPFLTALMEAPQFSGEGSRTSEDPCIITTVNRYKR